MNNIILKFLGWLNSLFLWINKPVKKNKKCKCKVCKCNKKQTNNEDLFNGH